MSKDDKQRKLPIVTFDPDGVEEVMGVLSKWQRETGRSPSPQDVQNILAFAIFKYMECGVQNLPGLLQATHDVIKDQVGEAIEEMHQDLEPASDCELSEEAMDAAADVMSQLSSIVNGWMK